MLRFRNPGTQYSTQVQVIKQLYAALGHQESFSLNDMAVVIAQGRLMTAYGYAGDDAIRLSMTDQESMNSALMNAKMYAEVFRMLMRKIDALSDRIRALEEKANQYSFTLNPPVASAPPRTRLTPLKGR